MDNTAANDLLWWELRLSALDGLCEDVLEKDQKFKDIIAKIYDYFGESEANDLPWWELRLIALDGLCEDVEKDQKFKDIIAKIYDYFGESDKVSALLAAVGSGA